jgi:DNA repair protein RadA/Sms
MPKNKSVYVCRECGYESPKWYGKCPGCLNWNTLDEEIREAKTKSIVSGKAALRQSPVLLKDINSSDEHRHHTGINEFDRVLGGGIVKGSLILLGGDPGIGKSTILLQVCEYLSKNLKLLYVSGEESKRQLKMRATRLGVNGENLYFITETDVESIIETIKSESPDVVIVDSIQTTSFSQLSSAPGSVVQVRECTNAFMHLAKSLDIPIFVVGHVNKDGAIAGPKVLEHIVDVVLYFEGDRQMTYRMLRAVKNRYGSTNEIGVFEMGDSGLNEVMNPSLMLLSGRPKNVSGTCVACLMEGTRPILAEIQGLATATGFGNPRRMSTGFDYNRMCLLLAVLEKRDGYYFSNIDAYVNVVGGLKLYEPAADLAVALALISSIKDVPIADDVVALGEIGLAGELRTVTHIEDRIRESARLGFTKCVLPYQSAKKVKESSDFNIELIGARDIRSAFESIIK